MEVEYYLNFYPPSKFYDYRNAVAIAKVLSRLDGDREYAIREVTNEKSIKVFIIYIIGENNVGTTKKIDDYPISSNAVVLQAIDC